MKYLDLEEIKKAFYAHLAQTGEYTEEEAEISFPEFPDPFGTAYLLEEYIGDCEIDGEQYSMCASWTDFWSIGVYDVPAFRFYTYYRASDAPNHQAAEYMAAKRLFRAEDLDEEDVPG